MLLCPVLVLTQLLAIYLIDIISDKNAEWKNH